MDDIGATSPTAPRHRLPVLRRLAQAAVLVGCLLHLTVRDSFPFPVAGLFYALPRPVLFLLAAGVCLLSRGWGARSSWFGVAAAIGATIAMHDVVWRNPGESSSTGETVVFWNVGRDLENDVAVVDGFLAQAPAILGLVETGPLSSDWLSEWRSHHPDYAIVAPQSGMLLAVRGKIVAAGFQPLANSGDVGWVDAEIAGRAVQAVVVDIPANPWISRKEPLLELGEWLKGRDDRPTILMGDFNTPDDSVWFEGLRRQFRETFRTAGRGYVPTWPSGAPVLKLDQIWVNGSVKVLRAWQTWSWRSDHRPQWAQLITD